jgi:RNA polymerase sigma-70 factor (ECF subfamily)
MDPSPKTRTSASLLGRLRGAGDAEAWALFVRRYGPLLYRWCRAWGLQEADIEDITQNVLVKLAHRLRDFQYDASQSFRAYLKTLAHYACCDLLADRRQAAADSAIDEQLNNVAAREDLAQRLAEEFDQELLEQAMQEVRGLVEPHTWEAFRLTAQEGLAGAEVAGRLNMTVTAVFKARSRVQQMLRERVEREGD